MFGSWRAASGNDAGDPPHTCGEGPVGMSRLSLSLSLAYFVLVGCGRRGVLDIRGRRDFSRFDPSPGDTPL